MYADKSGAGPFEEEGQAPDLVEVDCAEDCAVDVADGGPVLSVVVEAGPDVAGGGRWGAGRVPEEEAMRNVVAFPPEKGVVTAAILLADREGADPIQGAFKADLAVLGETC